MLNLLFREQWNNILGKQWNLFFIGTGSIIRIMQVKTSSTA